MASSLTLSAGALIELSASGAYHVWEASADRAGTPVTFPCGQSSSGLLRQPGSVLVAMDHTLLLDYNEKSGDYRALSCPSQTSAREGLFASTCRKMGYGKWPARRSVLYLGLGRVMLWERSTMQYTVYSFAERGVGFRALRNSSSAPFFASRPAGSGRLAGVHNGSQLLHLWLPVSRFPMPPPPSDAASAASAAVHVVVELLPHGSSYRVWNSEGWARHALVAGEWAYDVVSFAQSPLAGPVGRGVFPPVADSRRGEVRWVASPTLPVIVEVDTRQRAYRTYRVSVEDSLRPATSHQPPLHLEPLSDGPLDAPPMACEAAPTREACAAQLGPCGWCEPSDGLRPPSCTAGGPAGPCAVSASCDRWRFFDPVPTAAPPIHPSPPPSPPGLSERALDALEAHSRRVDHAEPMRAHADAAEGAPRPAEQLLPHDWLGNPEPRAASAPDAPRRRYAQRMLHALKQVALQPFAPPDNEEWEATPSTTARHRWQ